MKGTYIEMKEEIAIVTGSNRGIGFACVKECAAKYVLQVIDRKFTGRLPQLHKKYQQ